MNKIQTLFAGSVMLFALPVLAASQVTISRPGQPDVLVRDAENLAQLLTRAEVQGKTWWPGTVIAEQQASVRAQAQQHALLRRLQQWHGALLAENNRRLAVRVESLHQQIAALRVTGRQVVPVDADVVRLHPQDNHRLVGSYQLYLASEPTSVVLAGVVNRPGKTPWVPGRSVADYLPGAPADGAERSVVQLISPSGCVSTVPVAYWNQRHIEPQTGSIIVVGFSSWVLPDNLSDLNQQIVSLFTQRIPD